MLRTGTRPLPFADTVELMAVIIAGIRSREQDGRPVEVAGMLAARDRAAGSSARAAILRGDVAATSEAFSPRLARLTAYAPPPFG